MTRVRLAALLTGCALGGCVVLGGSVLGGCGAGAPPYAECIDDLDCGEPSDACYAVAFTRSDGTEREGAFCSRRCASDADCPGDGACLALEGDASETFFCVERCRGGAECYAPFACTDVTGADGVDAVCLP